MLHHRCPPILLCTRSNAQTALEHCDTVAAASQDGAACRANQHAPANRARRWQGCATGGTPTCSCSHRSNRVAMTSRIGPTPGQCGHQHTGTGTGTYRTVDRMHLIMPSLPGKKATQAAHHTIGRVSRACSGRWERWVLRAVSGTSPARFVQSGARCRGCRGRCMAQRCVPAARPAQDAAASTHHTQSAGALGRRGLAACCSRGCR